MKIYHKERLHFLTRLCLLFSFVLWGVAIYFFSQEVKNYDISPAASRELNRSCLILDTYDHHDIWHILSSFALFVSFLSMLTIDDDIQDKRRDEITVF